MSGQHPGAKSRNGDLWNPPAGPPGRGPGRPAGPPGSGPGRPGGKGKGSWAEMLSSSLPTCWKKNVLEVILDKDERGSFNVSESDCARMMQKIGLDIRPGDHVETIQICPNGRGIILITLKTLG